MNKEIFRDKLRENIREILKKKNISQVELKKKCEKLGYSVSQPEISKILAGKTPITVYQLSAFSKALNISLDQLLYGEQDAKVFYFSGDKRFLTNPFNEAYNGYMGMFYALLRTTSPFENKWLFGKLIFSASDDPEPICRAEFQLDTGIIDKKGRKTIKYYKGQLIISSMLGSGYCILMNPDIGEILFIEFRYRKFLVRQMECRLGLMISSSSGEAKMPVVQKILLSRLPFSNEEELAEVVPYLKFVQEEILISKDQYEIVRRKYKQYNIPVINERMDSSYYLINEEMIRAGNRKMNRFEIAKLLSGLRENAEAPWLYHITEREDSLVYSIVQEQRSHYNREVTDNLP